PAPRALPSFPTRRSSDLPVITGLRHHSTRQVDGPQTRVAARALTRKGDVAAVRRPGRALLEVAGRQDALARPVRLHHPDMETPADRKSTRLNSSHVKISY